MTEWEFFAVKYYRQGVRPDLLEQQIIETLLEYSDAIDSGLKLQIGAIVEQGMQYGRDYKMKDFENVVNSRSRAMTKYEKELFFDAALLGYLYGCRYVRDEPPKLKQVTAALSLGQYPTVN
jgi:hypothetical protein